MEIQLLERVTSDGTGSAEQANEEVGVAEKRKETFLDVCRGDDRNYR